MCNISSTRKRRLKLVLHNFDKLEMLEMYRTSCTFHECKRCSTYYKRVTHLADVKDVANAQRGSCLHFGAAVNWDCDAELGFCSRARRLFANECEQYLHQTLQNMIPMLQQVEHLEIKVSHRGLLGSEGTGLQTNHALQDPGNYVDEVRPLFAAAHDPCAGLCTALLATRLDDDAIHH